MLTADQRKELTKLSSATLKHDLGKQLHQTLGVAVGTWSYTRDGGAVGDYNLKDCNGADLKLPSGTLISNVVVVATTAVTSGGSLTLDVNSEAANDCLAATAVASLTANARIQGIPDVATVADWTRLTAERTLTISLNTAAATAGALTVFFWYLYP